MTAAPVFSTYRIRPTLPPHHLETLELVADGHTNREIAARLHLAERSVKTRISAIVDMLGARSRTHAVTIALQTGIITRPPVDMPWLPAAGVPVQELVAARRLQGLAGHQVAARLGMAPDGLYDRERGEKPFTVAEAVRYAQVVGVEVAR